MFLEKGVRKRCRIYLSREKASVRKTDLTLFFVSPGPKRNSGADPNVMARPLAGAMRPHNMLANVEARLSEPFAETCSGSDQRKSMKNSENRGK